MPVLNITQYDNLLDKLISNLKEVKARGSQMVVFKDKVAEVESEPGMDIIKVIENVGQISTPAILNIPLQLLSYHVALNDRADLDQPSNLAKPARVE